MNAPFGPSPSQCREALAAHVAQKGPSAPAPSEEVAHQARCSVAAGSAVCGNCGKPLSEHYHENEEYCFENTTGDIFTDDPSATLLANWLEGWNPTLHASLVDHWKREHGHTPNTVHETTRRTDPSQRTDRSE